EIQCFRSNIQLHTQSILKSNPFDFEIRLQQLHFTAQRNLICTRTIERKSQKLPETRRHAIGCFNIRHLKRGNRVQCVEQKMRLQLRLERLELRLRRF